MLAVFLATRTSPIGQKLLARTVFAALLTHIMVLIRVLACALKILRTSDWQINVIDAFAARSFALDFSSSILSEVIMAFVKVITETFGA